LLKIPGAFAVFEQPDLHKAIQEINGNLL